MKYKPGYEHQVPGGILILLELVKNTNFYTYKAKWQCYCGNIFETTVSNVTTTNNTKSCGCLRKVMIEQKIKDPNIQYLVRIYKNIKNRCYNLNCTDYKHYGGRGISMGIEWINNRSKFIEDILTNLGHRTTDKHQLDRIDNNGNYEISNLKWSTNKENNRNRRSARLITIFGETKTLTEWSELSGIKREVISDRKNRNWPEEKLLQPMKNKIKKIFDNIDFYSIWAGAKDRCFNKNSKKYKRYGGRGITIYDLWKDNYEKFQQDILDSIGVRPTAEHQLDRYPNNDGNYEPGNIRWATIKEQSVNKSDNLLIEVNGETKSCSQWADEYKMSSALIAIRYNKYGWRQLDLFKPIFISKFDENEIHIIKTLSLQGVSNVKIAKQMNSNPDTISDVLRNRGVYV